MPHRTALALMQLSSFWFRHWMSWNHVYDNNKNHDGIYYCNQSFVRPNFHHIDYGPNSEGLE
jgi:hypothetical protein